MAQTVKILVIDDDDLIRMTCRSILKKTGYQIIEAENGADGIELFKKERPDIVITDMLMPEKEGLETISEIRALDSKAKIIAMSGGGSTQNMSFLQLAQKLGATHLLNKPFKPDDLLNVIQKLLSP